MATSTLNKNIESVAKILFATLSEVKAELPFHISAHIQSEMGTGDKAYDKMKATWSASQQLQHRGSNGGGLANSFGGGKNSTTKITFDNYSVKATIGSALPYAKIHEEGGFIAAKNYKVTRSGRKIPAMAAYFWAMYFKSNKANPFFQTMALSVTKKGGVNIPARPYFDRSIKALQKHYDEVIYPDIELNIEKAWNGSN